ncbi:MAG: hypothetical protein PHI71_03255 [Acidiphilium sp.]|nr:hypothetical protein [Acidiphilium sp.]
MSEIVVVGGGLAGGAAACGLALGGFAAGGRAVTLLERDRAPVHKICGEFLSVEAQASLAAIGLDVAALGGHRISRLRLVRGAGVVEAGLPFEGVGVTRRTLDAALLERAESLGVTVRRGVAVREVGFDGGLRVDLAGGAALRPAIVVLASGKHEVRGVRRRVGTVEDLIGFKMYFRLDAAQTAVLARHIELYLWQDGYGGLQLVEDGVANFTLLIERGRYRAAGGTWAGLLAALRASCGVLDARLRGAVAVLDQPLTIFRVPYGFVHRPGGDDVPGLFRLGDQMAVIPSFTGDGMAIALHSASVAVATILAGEPALAHHVRVRRDVRGQIARASVLAGMARFGSGQAALFQAARLSPALLRLAARWTRVPPSRAPAATRILRI